MKKQIILLIFVLFSNFCWADKYYKPYLSREPIITEMRFLYDLVSSVGYVGHIGSVDVYKSVYKYTEETDLQNFINIVPIIDEDRKNTVENVKLVVFQGGCNSSVSIASEYSKNPKTRLLPSTIHFKVSDALISCLYVEFNEIRYSQKGKSQIHSERIYILIDRESREMQK